VRKGRVHRAAKDLNTQSLEVINAVAESDYLGRADKGPVKGIEEQNDVSIRMQKW